MKLSATQKEIVEKMQDGYSLKSQNSFGVSYWLSKDSERPYSKHYDVRKNTFAILLRLGVIKYAKKDMFKYSYYLLTKLGKNI